MRPGIRLADWRMADWLAGWRAGWLAGRSLGSGWPADRGSHRWNQATSRWELSVLSSGVQEMPRSWILDVLIRSGCSAYQGPSRAWNCLMGPAGTYSSFSAACDKTAAGKNRSGWWCGLLARGKVHSGEPTIEAATCMRLSARTEA